MFSLTACLRTQICSEPVAYEQRERTLSAHRGALRGRSLPALLMDGHLPPAFILLEEKAEEQVAETGRLRSAELPAVSPAQAVAPGPLLTTGEMLPRAARQRFSCRGAAEVFSSGSCGESRSGRDAAPRRDAPARVRSPELPGTGAMRCGVRRPGAALRIRPAPPGTAGPRPGSAENALLIFSLAV